MTFQYKKDYLTFNPSSFEILKINILPAKIVIKIKKLLL